MQNPANVAGRYNAPHAMRRDDLLDLNDVLQHPGRKLSVEVSTDLPEEAELDLVAPLEGTLECVSTGNLILFTGSFASRGVFECARCGAPIEVDLSFDMDESFPVEGVPSSYGSNDVARVVCDEPAPLFDGNQLMADMLLRQGLLLSLPLQPLCSFGWEGPCPTAAAKIAAGTAQPVNPEWSKLTQLLEDEGSS